MATSNTSPLASPPASTADNVTSQPPEPSTPSPNPSKNGNPPEPSPLSPPPPPAAPVASPPAISPPPVDLPPNSKPPTNTSPPPAPAKSPTPPTTITPSPEPPTSPPPPPTQVTVPIPTSPSPPPPPSSTPTLPSPPSAPPSSPPPPPPISKTPSSSPSTPAHSSPPPPAPKSKLPLSQPPPPHVPHPTPPPPLNKPTGSPPLAAQPPKSSPSAPVQDPPTPPPSRNTTSSSSSLIFSPPPLSSSPGPFVSSSPASISANSTTSGKGGVPMGGIVAVGLVLGFVMLGVIGLVALYISKRKRREFKHNGGYVVPSPFGSSPQSDSNLIVKTVVSSSAPFVRSSSGSGTLSPHSHGGLRQSRSWFTYQELYEATNGFSLEDLLGEGGFGCVYKGVLANGREVAVKQLKIGASQGEREFQAEVEIISRIHHRHLVSLDGYCISGSKRLLVYEYVPNQTLYYHLHGDNMPVMDWATRIKIVVGAAKGIAYLHEDCHPRIIHRDIKSSNILLDDKFEARVADFGLAKLALDVDTHVSTRVMGTFGYMAPEYATSGKLTDKSDVYSFGVVLLELLTGRKPVDESQPLGDESLVEWARPLLSHALETGEVNGLVDPRLEKNYVESELFLLIEASAACVRHSATKRPGMGQVVRALGGLSPSDLSNGMRVGQSEIYDSAQQSAEIRWFRRMAFGSQGYSTDYFSEAHNMDYPFNQTNQGPVLSAQHSQNDRSKQHSQSIYFSSHRTQGPSFSRQWSQDSAAVRQTAQNPVFQPQSSQNGLI